MKTAEQTKQCSRCHVAKALDEFYADWRSGDGKASRCKVCDSAVSKAYRQANAEKERGYKREYNERNRDRRREYQRAWEARNRNLTAERNRRDRQKHPERHRARHLVERALNRGALTRPSACSGCGVEGEQIEAHHEDYTRPLDVTWLCQSCHRQADTRLASLEGEGR